MEIEFSTVRDAELDEVNAWLAGSARIRPGFHELAARHDPLVLSSGFEELIRPLLAREAVEVELVANRIDPRPDGWRVLWNRDRPVRGLRRLVQARRAAACSRSSTSATATPTAARRSPPTRDLRPCRAGRVPRASATCRTSRSTTCTTCCGHSRADRAAPSRPRAVRLRALDGALPPLRARPREPLARGRPPSRRRRARGADRAGAAAASSSSRSTTRSQPVVATLLGLGVRPGRVRGLRARATPSSRRSSRALRGYRPPISPDPFETLVTSITAQQVSLASAFAIRSRMIERLGVRGVHALRVPDARAARGGARARRADRGRLLRPQGRVRRRSRARGPRLRRARTACRTTR